MTSNDAPADHVSTNAPHPFDSSADLAADSPAWPKVVGIISIVFGALGLICNGCGGILILATPFLLGMGEEQFGPAPDVMKPLLGQIVLIPVGLILALVLLFAGTMLLSRKPAARMLHLICAWLSTVVGLVSTYFGYQQIARLIEWKSANPGNAWADQIQPGQQVFFLVLGVVIALVWPLFILVWFGLIKRKPSDMGTAREVL